jgi:hypothetical protein
MEVRAEDHLSAVRSFLNSVALFFGFCLCPRCCLPPAQLSQARASAATAAERRTFGDFWRQTCHVRPMQRYLAAIPRTRRKSVGRPERSAALEEGIELQLHGWSHTLLWDLARRSPLT